MCRLGQGIGKTLGCATTFGTWVYFCTGWLSGGGVLQIKEKPDTKKFATPKKNLMTRILENQETRPGPRKNHRPSLRFLR